MLIDGDVAYVSVDVETAGPGPARYSMLSLGACLVSDPEVSLYLEFEPQSKDYVPSALEVSGLSLDHLAKAGLPLADGMQQLSDWLEASIPKDQSPTFVAFNAPFDWSFVNYAFHEALGHNPFGHAALDIKAFSMGVTGSNWKGTSFDRLAKQFLGRTELRHHALDDAQDQAKVFRELLHLARER